MSAAQMKDLAREGMAEGLTDFAELVHGRAFERTPDDPATNGDDLPGSLTVEPATPDDLTAVVYSDSEYAVTQHEALSYHHPNGGEAKYLEKAVLDSRTDGEQVIGAAMRRKLG